MKIAIHAADLDHDRIDGTRVYMSNVLKYLGMFAENDRFDIYHPEKFNPMLQPPSLPNYEFISTGSWPLWTQTRFALGVLTGKHDVLWMPMHNAPLCRRSNLKTVVTVHDLAFKDFGRYFPRNDQLKLNLLTDLAVRGADRLIAVSESTKRDILKYFPQIKEENIKVIHHGFDAEMFGREISFEDKSAVLKKFKIENSKFLLYVGAIQPRKNLPVLVSAYDAIKKDFPDLKLVLAGEKAWLWEDTMASISRSPNKRDIILTGSVPFGDLAVLYKSASIFVFPSLYEGFGIPLLEAFAAGVPVVAANNSSLPEVGGGAAEYFDAENVAQLAHILNKILENPAVGRDMIDKGEERAKVFSWKRCAEQTADWLRS